MAGNGCLREKSVQISHHPAAGSKMLSIDNRGGQTRRSKVHCPPARSFFERDQLSSNDSHLNSLSWSAGGQIKKPAGEKNPPSGAVLLFFLASSPSDRLRLCYRSHRTCLPSLFLLGASLSRQEFSDTDSFLFKEKTGFLIG